jgi:alkyl hydroperoxide reductase subunit AhpC
MATLCLDSSDCSAPLLHDWLNGDWALVFSHPTDFQDNGLEQDRWLAILREEFRARSVRPLACRRAAGDADDSWVGELIRDHRLLRLRAADSTRMDVIDLATRNLRDEIASLTSRFVLIIHPSLQPRGVLKYSAGRSSISPLDLLGSIDALRRRSPYRPAHRAAHRTAERAGEARAVA